MDGMTDLGDIGDSAPLAMAQPDASLAYRCEPVTIAFLEQHQVLWQTLVDGAVDDNPFLSPAFLIPLSMHADLDAQMTLIAIWRFTEGEKQLVGLVPLQAQHWKQAFGLLGRGQANLWKHPSQPFALPLLAGPMDIAEVALAAFTRWLSEQRPRIRTLAAHAVRIQSQFCQILAARSMLNRWPLQRGAGRSSTHGLDFKPSGVLAGAEEVQVFARVDTVRSGIEQLLGFDALSHNRLSSGEAVLYDPQHSAFLRATIRSFANQDKAIICMLDPKTGSNVKRAGAVVIVGRELGFLWWLAGPDEDSPVVEAALSAAAEKYLGKPVVAACQKQLAGLWAQPIRTEDWLMPLEASSATTRA
jgi:hypothetical protein